MPAVTPAFTLTRRYRLAASDPRSMPALVQLNAVTSPIFTGIGRSPVPVLLPFDTAAFLDARLNGAPASLSLSRYQADFSPADLFDAGPAGYDAVFSLEPGAGDGMPAANLCQARRSPDHRLDPALRHRRSLRRQGRTGQGIGGAIPRPAPLHQGRLCALCLHPLRRSLCGVDPVSRQRRRARSRLACREAYPVAERFLKALHVAGGLPSRPRMDIPAGIAERPLERSPDFTYRPSGDIIANSGLRQQGGHADSIAYSQIRFPLQKAARIRPFAGFQGSQSERQTARRASWPAETPSIPGGTIFARPAVSTSDSAPAVLAIRARISGPRRVRRISKAAIAATPSSRRWSPSATAS